ncbi:hypothetical protein [Sporosarcina cyprini]|uniref:hypothetical protein n=1 Tax=Sporosarcina cyprini TaxID=2910523 RepID=UPI001EE06AD0|nr:hypothetical protein [Sporosarcina cyprini]MCG3087066.1 hypothetical protein [Sporosarcina cyprini]
MKGNEESWGYTSGSGKDTSTSGNIRVVAEIYEHFWKYTSGCRNKRALLGIYERLQK